jgi:hypothetical protein
MSCSDRTAEEDLSFQRNSLCFPPMILCVLRFRNRLRQRPEDIFQLLRGPYDCDC